MKLKIATKEKTKFCGNKSRKTVKLPEINKGKALNYLIYNDKMKTTS